MSHATVPSWRTVQFFLEDYGVVETKINSEDTQQVVCDCPKFEMKQGCKHSRYVREKLDVNGHYPITIPKDIEHDAVAEALQTPEGFRRFIMQYSKVRVIGGGVNK